MPDAAQGLSVTLTQMPATGAEDANLVAIRALIRKGADNGSDVVLLPEYALHAGSPQVMRDKKLTLASEPVRAVAELAREFRVAVVLGGVKLQEASGSFTNSALAFGEQGDLLARYDKAHLFHASVAGTNYAPVAEDIAGTRLALFELKGVRIGLTICFDIRFPELFRSLAREGAEIVFAPSSFTRVTGEAHWRPLLRARAIENQIFVIASATIGAPDLPDSDALATYGHALAIGPWGEILADLGTEPLASQTLHLPLGELEKVRTRLPLHACPRPFETARSHDPDTSSSAGRADNHSIGDKLDEGEARS